MREVKALGRPTGLNYMAYHRYVHLKHKLETC
jgi:hypothetical protein